MSEEEVIKRRLLIDGDGTGDDRRLNNLIKTVIKWTNTSGLTDTENLGMYDRLLCQLSQCEYTAKRSMLLSETNKEQLEAYKTMQEKIEMQIEDVKESIVKSKELLKAARTLKGNRMQYDLLAQNIKEEPARSETEAKLESLRNDLNELNEEYKSIEEVIDKRRKQFYVLSSSANAMKALLEEKKSEDTLNTSLDDITNSPGPEPMSE